MNRWNVQERGKVVEFYLMSGSVVQAQRRFRRHYGRRDAPSRNAILLYVTRFRDIGTVAMLLIKTPVCPLHVNTS